MKTTKAGNFVFTPNELERYARDQFAQGYSMAKRDLANEPAEAKLPNIKAATDLLEQTSKIMSRAGSLIGKANHDNSR